MEENNKMCSKKVEVNENLSADNCKLSDEELEKAAGGYQAKSMDRGDTFHLS